jgi:hypothetical protein
LLEEAYTKLPVESIASPLMMVVGSVNIIGIDPAGLEML